MSLGMDVERRLLTWLDVERTLKQETALWSQLPAGIVSVDCFASGMEVRHSSAPAIVDSWLEHVFGAAYQTSSRTIQLRIGEATFPVELVPDSDEKLPIGRRYPLWRDVSYLSTTEASESEVEIEAAPTATEDMPSAWTGGPDLISFHSFKGGVGRTTALMTYVAACLNENSAGTKKILVVDADLEAPGVSFWLDAVNRPTVSFVQLVEALHYPPAGLSASLDYFSQELRKTSLNVGGLQRELFILPAALDLREIEDMPVAPEHLARSPENPWCLSDHLHALGSRLGVDAVFIDLRAGLSELASPILFDHRVDHFFVSTVAPQSVQGMAEVLRRLFAYNQQLPKTLRQEARPSVILSLLTKELRDAGHYEQALKTLSEAYPTDDPLVPGVQWLEAEFLSTLMSIGSVREAIDILPQAARLYGSASEWARSLYVTSPPPLNDAPSEANIPTEPRKQQAVRLHEVCTRAEFADSGSTSAILTTEPLLNLGKHFSTDIPNLLMIGAKGAGKTFTFRQLVGTGGWKAFLRKLGFDSANVTDAAIFPPLWSDNIEDAPGGEIKVAQARALELVGGDRQLLLNGTSIRRSIEDALRSPPDHWEDFWDCLVSRQFGLADGGLRAVNALLANHSVRIILAFDGIEDAFKDTNNENASAAIHALLRLPNRISELEDRHVGAIVFVRSDYVQATIRQNLGQWLQRFQPFRLQWNPESFLRLAFMLSCEAGIHDKDPKAAESLRIEELKTELEQLWGKRLGREKSKEAHSARWVYAALCDLKGNVQARDLVRFLKFAAESEVSRTGALWPDRLLAPESMRNAIPMCGVEKVTEAKSEIAPLRRWMELLEQHGVRRLKVPFSVEQAKLDANLLTALQEIGVIYEDIDGNLGEERLFLPEIYRHGLGFVTSATGRPRTQALLKKNIGAVPL